MALSPGFPSGCGSQCGGCRADDGDRGQSAGAHSSARPFEITHLELGRLHVPVEGPQGYDGIILYDPQLGYFYTGEQCYPFMYIFNKQEWVFYINGTGPGGHRWFYGMGTGWFSAD